MLVVEFPGWFRSWIALWRPPLFDGKVPNIHPDNNTGAPISRHFVLRVIPSSASLLACCSLPFVSLCDPRAEILRDTVRSNVSRVGFFVLLFRALLHKFLGRVSDIYTSKTPRIRDAVLTWIPTLPPPTPNRPSLTASSKRPSAVTASLQPRAAKSSIFDTLGILYITSHSEP